MLTTPSSDEVKNMWSYTFVPPICLYDTQRDNFTFTATETGNTTSASVDRGRRTDEYTRE